jgi:hypothetical protein
MSSDALNELRLQLDERNLAHVLSAVALAGLISRNPDARPDESTCCWRERNFMVRTAITHAALFDMADRFLRSVRWIPGWGAAVPGTFAAGSEIGSNPFISLAKGGQDKSPFKTFSGQQGPGDLLEAQKQSLVGATVGDGWLAQKGRGIASWGFDCRVGSHAYDLGFSSNDEDTGDRDPIYPAVEMLSIAGASFLTAIQGWQLDEDSVGYSIWTDPIPVTLVRYAVASRVGGLPARRYRARSRGGAYGKGAAYRFFPEATLQDQKGDRQWQK